MDIFTARKLSGEILFASNERIKEISSSSDVSLSVSALSGIQGFINSYSNSKIGAEELILLDGLASSITSSPKYYAAGSITTNEKPVADTLSDMMAKYTFLHPEYSAPCSVEQALNLGGEAVSFGKVCSFTMGEHSLISSDSDEMAMLDSILVGFDVKHCQNGICISSDRYTRKLKKARNGKR